VFQVSVGLDFQPDFCGLRPLTNAGVPKMRIVGGKEAGKGQFPWQAQIWVQSSPGKNHKRSWSDFWLGEVKENF
jgi:hypothetical protein